MKLIIVNNSLDVFTYASGAVIVNAESSTDVNPKYWYMLFKDTDFRRDLRLNNITIGDGIATYRHPESEQYIDKINVEDFINRDIDGTILSRVKMTSTGWHYQMHGIEFESSKVNSIYSKKVDGSDYNFSSMKFYELVEGVETEIIGDNLIQSYVDANCIKTIIDWEPNYDYEILGGTLRQKIIPTEDIRVWVVGAPDIPESYGGSKPFIVSINLVFTGLEEGIKVDGRSPKYMTYNPSIHSNKLRIILRHSAGFKHKMNLAVHLFKA